MSDRLPRPDLPEWLSAEAVGERLPDWLPLNGTAAVQATVLTLVVLGMFAVVQGSVAALFVGGSQPIAVVERVPTDPTAQQWEQAPSRTVELSKQQMALPYGGGSTDELRVQALTNETHVAFRLTWTDPTNDTSLAAPGKYSDAVAVMLKGGQQPPITMGAVGEPVNIWYWRAAWQYGHGGSEWTGDMYAYPHNDSLTRPGTWVGNPLSKATYEDYGQNYYAKGYGSLSIAPKQNVHARAERTENGWAVTFVRERSTAGKYDAAFDEHSNMYLAFAVWNGSAEEVNGQKSLTMQFSTLNTKTGALSAAGGGSGGGSGSGGSGSGGTGTGGGGAAASGGSPLTGWMGVLVAVTLLTWVVAYWRMRP